jgi:hypothetical protein
MLLLEQQKVNSSVNGFFQVLQKKKLLTIFMAFEACTALCF